MSTRGYGGGTEWGGYLARARHAARHRWRLVLCAALAVSALALMLDAFRGGGYTAEALVRVQDLGEAGVDGTSRERLSEIQAAAGPEEVARSAMGEIGWEGGIGEFDRRLDVRAGDGGALSVGFYADNPQRAAEGANAYAGAFVDRVERSGDRLAGGALSAGAEVVREAQPPPASPWWPRPLAVGLAALLPGLTIGTALAMALGGGDRRWRDARDAELTLGAPVLGVIPEHGSGERESEEGIVVREP